MTQLRARSGNPRRALLGAAVGLAVAACGGPGGQPAASTGSAALPLTGDTTCTGPSVHEKHVAQFACDTCHPTGATWGFGKPYTFPSGRTTTAGGAIVRGTGTTPTSCTVACHYPMGAAAHAVGWTDPGPLSCTACHDVSRLPAAHPAVSAAATRGDCQVCHVIGDKHMTGTVVLQGHDLTTWMARTDPGFHAFSANRGIASCTICHGADLSGGTAGVACADCHNGVKANDFRTCTACHGGKDNLTGAPPAATWGYAGDPNRGGGTLDAIRAGAHTSHVTASAIAPIFDCAVCHVVPLDALSHGHIDAATATVSFAGLASGGVTAPLPPPTWDRTTATCSSTYCHGATLTGGTSKTPVWTAVGQGQAACGTCHGVPPVSANHPPVSNDLKGCNPCHSGTIDANGGLIPPSAGGMHLDGTIEATGGHAASWMDTSSPDFHAFSANRGIASCTSCHGADLSGGTAGVPCANCHKAAALGGTARDFATCTACHGGIANQTGAPPAATWGYAGDPDRGGGTLDPVRVGAHTKHVAATLATPFDCGVCHVKPTVLLSPKHVDAPTALVTWSGVAAGGGASPFWNRVDATCSSTYCHGNYSGTYAYDVYDYGSDAYFTKYASYVGKNAIPTWTDGPMTCASCHGNPPANTGVWHSGSHGYQGLDAYNECQTCHPDATSVDGVGTAITSPHQHVNGTIEVTPRWTTRCFGCH